LRPDPQASPLLLEVFTADADVRVDESVTLHMRVRNAGTAPIGRIMVGLDSGERLQVLGAIGSTAVQVASGALQIEHIAELGPSEIAEWWVVLRASAAGEARARAMAVSGDGDDASYEATRWRIAEGDRAVESAPTAADLESRIRKMLERGERHRVGNRPRDELFALYAARVLMDQTAGEVFSDARRADVIDRTRELYAREYGGGPRPHLQARLPRTSVLSGIVVDQVTQAPLPGATVVLRSMFTDAEYATTKTMPDGGFQFADLGAELMTLEISTPGYRTRTKAGFELRPGAITRLIAELEQGPRDEPRFADGARDLAELHGTLSGYRGDGAHGVQVILAGTDTLEARTDERGEFRFAEIAPGDYTFVAVKPGFATIERRAVRVDPGGVIEVQFTLEPE
jgi:hypothetical protein